MASELSPDRDLIVDQLVQTGLYPDRRHALDRAVDLLCDEAESVAAIREGLASFERGEGTSLAEVAKELRDRYQIREDA